MSTTPMLTAVERYLAAELEYAKHSDKTPHCASCTSRLCEAKANLVSECHDALSAAPGIRRILVAADYEGHPAINTAITIARPLHAEIAVVYVVEPAFPTGDESAYAQAEILEQRRATGNAVLAEIREQIPRDIPVMISLREGSPANEIIDAASEWDADLVIIGTHRRGPLARFFLGSVSRVVLRRADCPVLLVADVPAPGQTPAPTPRRNAQTNFPVLTGTT